jgi:hypothetical protein
MSIENAISNALKLKIFGLEGFQKLLSESGQNGFFLITN